MKRKIEQITAIPATDEHHALLLAICNDGTVWRKRLDWHWEKEESIPQDNEQQELDELKKGN
jgi:hypothetical protein